MLDVLIKAAIEAAKSAKDKEKAQLDHLRAENDARLAAEWAYQQAMEQRARQSAAPPVAVRPPTIRRAAPVEIAAPAPTAKRHTSADARTIAKWAKPATLRSQFILTEILKPPLSMRRK